MIDKKEILARIKRDFPDLWEAMTTPDVAGQVWSPVSDRLSGKLSLNVEDLDPIWVPVVRKE